MMLPTVTINVSPGGTGELILAVYWLLRDWRSRRAEATRRPCQKGGRS